MTRPSTLEAFSNDSIRVDGGKDMDSNRNQSVSTADLANESPLALNDSDRTGSREDHLEDRIHQVLEQRLVSLLGEEGTNREIRWLTQSGGASAIAPADLERLEQLETQIQTLSDRLPENLSDSLNTNQTQLQAVSQQLETLETMLNQNQAALTEIETSIDELQQSLFLKDTTSSEPEEPELVPPDSR